MSAGSLGLSLQGVGLCSPVGTQAAATCAAMRAGIAVIEEIERFEVDKEPIHGSFLATLDAPLRADRICELLGAALVDLEQRVGPDLLRRCPAILICEGERARTERALRATMPHAEALVVTGSPTRVVEALATAARWIADGSAHEVLICASDCRITGLGLRELRDRGRLRTRKNPHGVIPGEAAACVLVSRSQGRAGEVELVSYGVEQEPSTLSNDVALRAAGLSAAVRGALASAGSELDAVDWWLADHGDETMFAKERAMVLARLLRAPRPSVPIWQYAEFIGYCGAAGALAQMIWASEAWARGYAPGERALCVCSDPDGPRGVLLARHL